MTWPGLPTSLSGAYVIQPGDDGIDQEVQARYVTRLGKPFGIWYDDTTDDLDAVWLPKGIAKYGPLKQTVFVCIPPGEPHLRHSPSPPVVNVQEWYPYGEVNSPPADWGPIPKRYAYCLQYRYPGTSGKRPPTAAEFQALLAEAQSHHPRFIFLF